LSVIVRNVFDRKISTTRGVTLHHLRNATALSSEELGVRSML